MTRALRSWWRFCSERMRDAPGRRRSARGSSLITEVQGVRVAGCAVFDLHSGRPSAAQRSSHQKCCGRAHRDRGTMWDLLVLLAWSQEEHRLPGCAGFCAAAGYDSEVSPTGPVLGAKVESGQWWQVYWVLPKGAAKMFIIISSTPTPTTSSTATLPQKTFSMCRRLVCRVQGPGAAPLNCASVVRRAV
jgi:hypothetical protein